MASESTEISYVLVAGGSPASWPNISETAENVRWVGIDRGCFYLLQRKLPIWFANGDFDSLPPNQLRELQAQVARIYTSRPEKDDTDTQLALVQVLAECPTAEIKIIGGTGGRLDHFLANLWLPLEPRFRPHARQITLLDKWNTITYYLPGTHQIKREVDKSYLAYVCLTPVTNLSLYDSKYTLMNEDVAVPTSYASNEFVTETASFSFDSGIVAVIQSTDANANLS